MKHLTFLAKVSKPTGRTRAMKSIESIEAGPSILTRTGRALILGYGKTDKERRALYMWDLGERIWGNEKRYSIALMKT